MRNESQSGAKLVLLGWMVTWLNQRNVFRSVLPVGVLVSPTPEPRVSPRWTDEAIAWSLAQGDLDGFLRKALEDLVDARQRIVALEGANRRLAATAHEMIDAEELSENADLRATNERLRGLLRESIDKLQWSTGAWGNTREEDLVTARPILHSFIAKIEAELATKEGNDD